MKISNVANWVGVLYVLFFFFAIATSIYGVVLSFSASILIGIGALIIQPCPFIFGIANYFGYNIPEVLSQWLYLSI